MYILREGLLGWLLQTYDQMISRMLKSLTFPTLMCFRLKSRMMGPSDTPTFLVDRYQLVSETRRFFNPITACTSLSCQLRVYSFIVVYTSKLLIKFWRAASSLMWLVSTNVSIANLLIVILDINVFSVCS